MTTAVSALICLYGETLWQKGTAPGASASVFADGDVPGYIVTGILAFIFLAIRLSGETGNDPRSAKYFALPTFSAAMAVVFSLRGSYFENAIMGATMAFLGYFAMKGLILKKDTAVSRAALFFYASEYLLWIASCFWVSDRFFEPYYLIDTFLLNASLIVIAVSQWKEEAKCPIS